MPTRQNSIIAMLPASVTQRLGQDSQIMHCEQDQVLLDGGEPIVHVYFPIDSVVPLDQVVKPDADDTASAPGVAVIGSEGVAGMEAFFGAELALISRPLSIFQANKTLHQARATITAWRRDYNEVRPHGSIGRIPPARFAEIQRRLIAEAAQQHDTNDIH